VWSALTEDQRDALCRRGLDDIFDARLRDSISALIDDVRVRGDQAVCDALATHDGI
jgi:histidinol dehydrogenase